MSAAARSAWAPGSSTPSSTRRASSRWPASTRRSARRRRRRSCSASGRGWVCSSSQAHSGRVCTSQSPPRWLSKPRSSRSRRSASSRVHRATSNGRKKATASRPGCSGELLRLNRHSRSNASSVPPACTTTRSAPISASSPNSSRCQVLSKRINRRQAAHQPARCPGSCTSTAKRGQASGASTHHWAWLLVMASPARCRSPSNLRSSVGLKLVRRAVRCSPSNSASRLMLIGACIKHSASNTVCRSGGSWLTRSAGEGMAGRASAGGPPV